MGANRRMKEVKAAILSLLAVSYQKRDRVGLLAFRKDSAELLLGFTRSVELAQKQLEKLPTGGRTPLAQGLTLAYEIVIGKGMTNADRKTHHR
jgi:magnesium chelatase subunit D